ncbi:SEC-C metal-binding domain-containing protein [Myxococcus sp. SDU36]|uniref:SEC-C metal-binding domain-containing protein n=1 Tax=Myxococcus sp. SDU36 TaxID=2831967 RepID=UPI002543F87E|nr:SEC-C metal-binding domain-containing protein [Myxococcus sp. SDU36]WIG97910.1 SEC-C domain-containing protein [Myxococcus sp. SDU36]
MKPGRNDPCSCGSGEKYKRCCMAKDAAAARTVAPTVTSASPAPSEPPPKTRPGGNTLRGTARALKPKPLSAPPPSLVRKRGE